MGRTPRTRKPVDREAKEPSVYVVQGELSIADRALMTQLFGRIFPNVVTKSFTPAEYEQEIVKLSRLANVSTHKPTAGEVGDVRTFSSLRSPDQWLIREHLEDFQEIYGKTFGLGRGFAGRTFNFLVDGRGTQTSSFRLLDDQAVPTPPEGIQVVTREEAGFSRYRGNLDTYGKSKYCGQFAVSAGGVAELGAGFEGRIGLETLELGLLAVSQQLQTQFVTS